MKSVRPAAAPLLLLVLAATVVVAAPSTVPPRVGRLGDSIADWPSIPWQPPIKRWWDVGVLERAVEVASYHQFVPLLEKLERGEPITVVAVGSSVTSDHGGCFNSSAEALASRVQALSWPVMMRKCLPSVLRPMPARPQFYDEPGWLAQFMGRVNATWPHRDHLLVNSGRAAHSLSALNDLVCLESELPRTFDLAILEQPAYLDGAAAGEHMEQLVTRLLHLAHAGGGPPPAIITFSGTSLTNGNDDNSK